MLAVDFKERNKVFGKPANMTDEQCFSLPVWQGMAPVDDKGTLMPVIISCWKFSKEDLERIAETGEIWLSITGCGMPPVSLFTEYPFDNG